MMDMLGFMLFLCFWGGFFNVSYVSFQGEGGLGLCQIYVIKYIDVGNVECIIVWRSDRDDRVDTWHPHNTMAP